MCKHRVLPTWRRQGTICFSLSILAGFHQSHRSLGFPNLQKMLSREEQIQGLLAERRL